MKKTDEYDVSESSIFLNEPQSFLYSKNIYIHFKTTLLDL